MERMESAMQDWIDAQEHRAAEIWKIAEKWGDTLRAVANKTPDGRLIDTSLGMTLNCTIRDAIREALGLPEMHR